MPKAQNTRAAAPAGAKRKLTRAEKKEIAALIQKAKGDGKPHTAQQTIPYLQMYPDGICHVSDKRYSKSIAYEDINYQLAQADDKTAIFENWCDFLNYFDASVSVQLSFINQGAQREKAQQTIDIPPQDDAFNSIRSEYAAMLKNQLEKGNNGLVKQKYITFSIEADNLAAAKARLSRIETDVLNNFKVLGVTARPQTGYERLQTLHGVFHPEGEPFRFSWDWLAPSGLNTKDFIAPSSFRFGEGRYFRMGRKLGAVSFLEILAPELNDRMLADILDLETGVIVNLHIRSIDQTEAIKTIKRKITDLDKMKIEEQKKAVRSGYDMDIIPSDLATFGSEAKNLLQDLQSRNERMFLLTFLVVNMADTKRKLDNDVFAAAGIAQKYNCALTRLDYMQEAGFMASVPIGENLIPIQRGLTTSSTAIFIPFITQELFQTGASLYYGLNALSNNMILCDRKKLKNPNGLILGTPGSGKSFAAKREMANAFLITDDDIIICDPEAEYYPLVQRLHGQVVRISPTSSQYVNPMDINLNYSEDDNPLALKSDFILSLCELVVGGKEGLQPVEKTVIDRAVRNVYRPFLADPDPEKMPILGDLYDELLKQPEPEAARIAAALELYVSGSLNVFNHRTNVELSNRLVCFDIKQLGKQLKKLGMLIVQDQVWNRVTVNRAEKKSTRYYMDEFHLLLKEEQTAAYSVEIWKRFRKWGGIPTAITQNVKDLLSSREVENIFENSDFVLMLNQAAGDRAILAKQLNISPQQMKYVTHTEAGEGLLFYGNVILPFVDRFPKDTELYQVMTTKPEEVSGA
ncbi:MAG: conjugal transfer protein TraE [Enterocloster citroniae]|nr:conjugal transfer protein TraE [Enterocloster citroniae]